MRKAGLGVWGFGRWGGHLLQKMLWGGPLNRRGCLNMGGWLIEEIQYTYKQYDPYMFCALLLLHQQSSLWNHQVPLGLWCISIVLYFQHNHQWFAPSIFLKRQILLICWIPGWSKETGNSIIDETSQDLSKPNYSPLGNFRRGWGWGWGWGWGGVGDNLHFLENFPVN